MNRHRSGARARDFVVAQRELLKSVQRLARWILALLLVGLASRAGAESCIWFGDGDRIYRVSSDSDEVVASAPLRKPHRLVMNADDCGVWALDKHDRWLLKFRADGTIERIVPLTVLDPRLDRAERLEINAYDGTLWISDDRWLFHVSPLGDLLGRFAAPDEIRHMQVALDRSLWVLGRRELWHFTPDGMLVGRYAPGRNFAADARFFAIDSIGGVIWVAAEDDLARLEAADPEASPQRIRLPGHLTSLALDPVSGKLWVAWHGQLRAFSRTAEPVHQVSLEALRLREPQTLAFDPAARSLWMGSERSVSRFTDTGTLVARLEARDADEALGVPAFRVLPSLTLLRPPKDALTNNPRPEFALAYAADCNGAECNFGAGYFKTYGLIAHLNGEEVGGSFQLVPDSSEARYVSPSRLPEGTNTFTARVKDAFGHESGAISNSFVVDTTAPRFVTLSPADGTIVQSAQVVVQGTTDDASATVVLNGVTQNSSSFAFPLILAPGLNALTVSAIDPAGNTANAVLRLTLVPVSVSIAAPSTGASVSGDAVIVTGTYQGPPNTGITVNGVVAATDGSRFYAQVALKSGSNVIAVSATSPEGASVTQSVSVTASGPGQIQLLATPTQGIAPLPVTFGALSDTPVIARIEADYDGDGTVDFTSADPDAVMEHTYPTPGVYEARFAVTDVQGATHPFTGLVVVNSLASMDAMLRGVYTGMLTKLRAGDIDGALTYFTAGTATKYRTVFSTIGAANLPSVVDRLGTIDDGTISDQFAEYVLVRNKPAGPQAYLVYLIRGQDGVWRIDGM